MHTNTYEWIKRHAKLRGNIFEFIDCIFALLDLRYSSKSKLAEDGKYREPSIYPLNRRSVCFSLVCKYYTRKRLNRYCPISQHLVMLTVSSAIWLNNLFSHPQALACTLGTERARTTYSLPLHWPNVPTKLLAVMFAILLHRKTHFLSFKRQSIETIIIIIP